MKIFKLLFIAFIISSRLSVFASEEIEFPLTINKKNYTAVIGSNGYISSIKVKGQEFLAAGKSSVPGAFFLCAGASPGLENFKKTGENSFEGRNLIAKIAYQFEDNKINIKISDIKKRGSLYIIINQAVKKVSYQNADNVPTTAATPVKADCDRTCWLLDKSSLYINGGNLIWGPWKKHQVWDARLKPGRTADIEIVPGGGNDSNSNNEAETVRKSPVEEFTYSRATEPGQIPLCMIGDSITWAGEGDYWRKYLLENIPRLAFVGTHSAVLGYSHAGEGGNSTLVVLSRLNQIPDCPYYSLLIGTNDTGVKDKSECRKRADQTAGRIQKIVFGLLKKKGVKKVFLCSIMPCSTKNPLRDKTNSMTNVILREKMKTVFPKDKVVWVEFEYPIRKIKGWESKIKLHPTLEGYKIIAKIHADAIAGELKLKEPAKSIVLKSGSGVKVDNLWDKKNNRTSSPVIAGWYTLSFKVSGIKGKNPEIKVTGGSPGTKNALNKTFKVSSGKDGRMSVNFFTGYEGYGYTRSYLKLEPVNCKIDKILFEKSRPSHKASIYGEGTYVDTVSKALPGELIETVNAYQRTN
jgi:hypothetical protein